MGDPVAIEAYMPQFDPIGDLADRMLLDRLNDRIAKEKDYLLVTPNERREWLLNQDIIRRDICILAIGIQELTESVQDLADKFGSIELMAKTAAGVSILAGEKLCSLRKRLYDIETKEQTE